MSDSDRPTIPPNPAELIQALTATNELIIALQTTLQNTNHRLNLLNMAQLASEGRDIALEERVEDLEEWRDTFAA